MTLAARFLLLAGLAAALLASSVAAAGGGVAGKYATTIKSPAQIKGTWSLNLKPGGAYVVSLDGRRLAGGTWSATSTTITLREPAGCGGTGTYGWKKTKTVLRFTKKREDARCQTRAAVLAHPFAEAR